MNNSGLGILIFIIFTPNEEKHIEKSVDDNEMDFSTPADKYYKKCGFDIYYYTGLPRNKEYDEMDLAGYAMEKRYEESLDNEDEEYDDDLW